MVKPVILCIDDEPIILYSLREQIIRGVGEGYQIELAQSGQEALELCAELNEEGIAIPLVICDQHLPYMLGDEILSRLHRLYPKTLKILLTGQANFQGVIKAVNQANLYHYIAKPWQEIDLILTVKEALHSYELNQQIRKQNQVLQQVNQELHAEIQRRKQTEKLLKASEARLESILNSLEDVVWSASVTDLELLYLNPSAEKLYGYPMQMFLQNNSLHGDDVVHPEDQNLFQDFLSRILIQRNLLIKYRIICPDGQIKWVKEQAQVIYDSEGKALRIDGTIYDITQQKLAEDELTHAAFHDSLTGLPNRAFFLQQLDLELKRSQHYYTHDMFAVLFLDLDDFKQINDNLGHDLGDLYLIAIAQRLQKCLRESDLLARLGGDEFTIFLRKIKDQTEVRKITQRILHELSVPHNLKNQVVSSGASIGVVIADSQYRNSSNLLRDADLAMYNAKNSGKNRYVIFDEII